MGAGTQTTAILSGKPFQDRTDGIKYNAQVASASEKVTGRFACKGSTDAIAELATFGKRVIGVFDSTDIAAGVTVGAATNVGTQDAASQTATLVYVPTGEAGQVMVFPRNNPHH